MGVNMLFIHQSNSENITSEPYINKERVICVLIQRCPGSSGGVSCATLLAKARERVTKKAGRNKTTEINGSLIFKGVGRSCDQGYIDNTCEYSV